MIRQKHFKNRTSDRTKRTYPILLNLSKGAWLLGLLLFSPVFLSSVFSQSEFYIDPSYSGSQKDGSISNPFTSFSDFQWENGATYLLKRGTLLKTKEPITISSDNVVLSSYGAGERPVIEAVLPSSRVITVKGNYVTVKDLDVRALDDGPDNAAGCVIDMIRATNPVIDNCKTTGGTRGINASETKGTATIINCHITDTWDDGMYNRLNDTVIIENTLVERVNLKYHINPDQTYAGGDCIQFDYVKHFELRNSVLDKTYTGGKFCLIADHFETGIAEDSRFIGAEKQHGVYLGIGNHFIFRRNNLSGGQYGVWNKSVNTEIYHNILQNTALAGYYGDSPASSVLYNNLFVSCGEAILSWNEKMSINNNIFYQNTKAIQGNFSNINHSNNCYYPGNPPSPETAAVSADPLFIDPAAGNYRLQASSPCIDAGIEIEGIYMDINHSLVPSGNSMDIGPYEYGAGQTDPVESNESPVIKLSFEESVTSAKVAQIDASGSMDPDNDNLIFSWSAPEGIQLSSNDSPKVRFLAPDVSTMQSLTFQLSLSDGKETVSRSILIDVVPFKPNMKKSLALDAEASSWQEPNYPINAIDNNIETRWSAEGDNNWLSLELESETTLSHIKLAFYGGDRRTGYFDLHASIDGENWDVIIDKASTSGLSQNVELFEIPREKSYTPYRYVRLTGHKNSENDWNSYSELKIFGISTAETTSEDNSGITTGLEDPAEITDFNIYPNPSSGDVNIDFSAFAGKSINAVRIISLNGKVVWEKSIGYAADNLHFGHDLLDGIYVLQVLFADASQANKKLIVRR